MGFWEIKSDFWKGDVLGKKCYLSSIAAVDDQSHLVLRDGFEKPKQSAAFKHYLKDSNSIQVVKG